MNTLRQKLAVWAVDESYAGTAELIDIIKRVESYNQFLPGVHQNLYPVELSGQCSHLCGSLWEDGGDITCFFGDDIFDDGDNNIIIPNSVLDAEDWEVEIKRLTDNRHEAKLKQDVQYFKNCIHAYEEALIQQKLNLAEAEQKLLALGSHPV